MQRLIFATLLGLLLAAGCASRPNHELDNARQALANADAVGAREIAEAEYQSAVAALRHAEELVQRRQYQAARELLPLATEQARLAFEQAVAARQELARQQALRVERQQRQADARARKQVPVEVPSSSPPKAQPAPVKLSQYAVTTAESLWEIASRAEVYADGLLWPLLYKANRDQIKDPLKVYPGQILAIPRDATPQELEAARIEAVEAGIFNHDLQRDPPSN